MSSQMQRLLRAGLCLAVVSWLVSGPTQAQDKRDLADEAKQRQQLTAQQLEEEFKKVWDDARTIAVNEPAKAVVMLKALRERIAADTKLPDENRTRLLRRIDLVIMAYTDRAEDLRNRTPRPLARANPKRSLDDIDRWWKQPQRDTELPPDWFKRLTASKPQPLTSGERRLIKALNTPVEIDLKDSTLEAVIDYLQDKTGVSIIVPTAILEKKNITYKTPVSISFKNVTLRTILKKVLSDVGLTYIIDHQAIQVTTEERVKLNLTTRSYPIGNLLPLQNQPIDSIRGNQQAMKKAINDIIDVIVTTIEPDSWWLNGGLGEIKFDPTTMSLVVKQTAEVHLLLGQGGLSANAAATQEKSAYSSEERKLLAALSAPLDIDLNDATLKDVLKYLQTKAGVAIIVSRALLDEKVINDQTPVSLRLKGASLRTILSKALSQVANEELDYAIRPEGIVITRPRLAAHTMVYDVRDLVEQMPLLRPLLMRADAHFFRNLPPSDGPALLVRSLTNAVNLHAWETIEFRNQSRLIVFATPVRQEEIGYWLATLRELANIAVVMNARLYEVDRAFFIKHVAPLFAEDKDSDERPVVVRIDATLLKAICKRKLLLESDRVKLRPTQETTFLSQQSVFRYRAGPDLKKEGSMLTGLAGVSFTVRPLISPDRRYLRLQISQQAVQLVGLDKTNKLDVFSGRETEVETPNLRKTVVTGTIQIPDTAPILMPVNYQPPGKDGEDKVWLLVARPFIWIEAEEQERRKVNGDAPFQSHIWESDVPKDEKGEKPAPVTLLPSDDKTMAILQAVIKDVLTNPMLKKTRDFYGTAKDKTVTLSDGDSLGWPKRFHPETPGFQLVQVHMDPFDNSRRILGIRVDKFDLEQKAFGLDDTPIIVCLFNAGGSTNGGTIGGCFVYYKPKRVGNRWTVEYCGLLDP